MLHRRLLCALVVCTASSVALAQPGPDPRDETNPLQPPGEAERFEPIEDVAVSYEPMGGVRVATKDGAFSLRIGLRAQFLFSLLHDPVAEPAVVDNFQIRRARAVFGGNVFREDIDYKLELAISPRDLNIRDGVVTTSPLLDFYFDFEQLQNLSVRIGQYKVPFSRERVVSSGDLAFVDRSIVNAEFNVDRDVGVEVYSEDLFDLDLLRYHLGVYAGEGRDADEADFFQHMYIARVEVLPMGDFEDYDELDWERVPTPKLSVGVAYAFVDDAAGVRGILGDPPADLGTTDVHVATADAMLHWAGFSGFGALFLREGIRDPGGAVDEGGAPIAVEAPHDGVGWTAQGLYLLPATTVGIGARWAGIRGTGVTALGDLNSVGATVGMFPWRHALKLQADYFFEWQDDAADGVHEVRVQLQGEL